MVQDDPANSNDGADEQMLGAESENGKVIGKREEVKFIKGDQQNGDAKIDIGATNGKTFTGMTKEELMKYANDPFWVRLRWIFFISFWAIWVGMLVGAILIILAAPKCPAPEPLPWYKRGLLAKFDSSLDGQYSDDVVTAKRLHATGAIYELPAQLTYAVKDPEVERKIRSLVDAYKDSGVKVIVDVTPNYVVRDSALMQDALKDANKRSAFVWRDTPTVPNNWLSIENGSAWAELQPGNFVLSQFGDGLYDLHMNSTIVREAFNGVLKHLIELGVRGIRLKNTKFYLLSTNLRDELPNTDPNYIHTQYGFWTHAQTTFQDGLGNVLADYRDTVHNAAPSDAFMAVSEDIIRPEVYRSQGGAFGIDMPIYGRFVHRLSVPEQDKRLKAELITIGENLGNGTWLQWDLQEVGRGDGRVPVSSFLLFISLLSGVPLVPADSPGFNNLTDATYKQIEVLRLSPSYMHGEFHMYDSNGLIAYARIKSGNPGYLIVFNPTEVVLNGNFADAQLPEEMTVVAISDNYDVPDITIRSKVKTANLPVSSLATIILTYVPVKSG